MVVTKSVTGLRSIGLYLFYVFKMSVLSITPCEQSLKELTAVKETEGQRQLLMFGSRNRRTKSRKERNYGPLSRRFLATPLLYETTTSICCRLVGESNTEHFATP